MRLSLLKKQDCLLKRRDRSKDYFEDGKLYTANEQIFTIIGSPQPLSGNEVLQLKETDRHKKILNFYTTNDIKISDIVEIENEEYEVLQVHDWSKYFFNHKKARIAFMDEQDE